MNTEDYERLEGISERTNDPMSIWRQGTGWEMVDRVEQLSHIPLYVPQEWVGTKGEQ